MRTMSARETMGSQSRYYFHSQSVHMHLHFRWNAAKTDCAWLCLTQGERYAHIASHVDGVVFDSTPIQNRAINGANAMAAVPGVPSLLWPVWWGALATWWHLLAGYCYPPDYRDVSANTGVRCDIITSCMVCENKR